MNKVEFGEAFRRAGDRVDVEPPEEPMNGRQKCDEHPRIPSFLEEFHLLAPVVQKPVGIGVDEILVPKHLRHSETGTIQRGKPDNMPHPN